MAELRRPKEFTTTLSDLRIDSGITTEIHAVDESLMDQMLTVGRNEVVDPIVHSIQLQDEDEEESAARGS